MCDSIHFIIKQLTVIRQRHDDAALFVEHRFAARPEFQLLQTVKTFPRRAAEIPPEPNLAVLRAATMPPRGPVMPRDAGTTTPSAPTCSILLLFLLPAPNLGTGRGRRGSRRRAARARRRPRDHTIMSMEAQKGRIARRRRVVRCVRAASMATRMARAESVLC